MYDVVVDVELYIIPQDCFVTFHLPMVNLHEKLELLCDDSIILNKVLVVDCKSSLGIEIEERENVLMFNNLLLNVNKMNDSKKEKFIKLLKMEESKNLITLLTLFHDIDNYEIISSNRYKSQNELYQTLGGLWILSLVPDVAIALDGYSLITNEQKEACFWNGIKSGSIKFVDGNFFVPNHEILKRTTNIDYNLIEELGNYI